MDEFNYLQFRSDDNEMSMRFWFRFPFLTGNRINKMLVPNPEGFFFSLALASKAFEISIEILGDQVPQ